MRPETATVVKKIIEKLFNNTCASYNIPADREAYYKLLLDYIQKSLPNQDAEFYFSICLDFWESVIEPSKFLDQTDHWGKSPYGEMEALVITRSNHEGEAPGEAEIISQEQPLKAEGRNLLETREVLDQISALGDCLIAIAEEKDFQPRKQTFVSLGVLIHQVVAIVKDLLDRKEIK